MSQQAPFTQSECRKWMQDKERNPRTGRKINPDAKRGVYKTLETQCAQIQEKQQGVRVSKDDASPGAKYCRCLMHVRAKTNKTPYGICTKSVLHKYNASRPQFCDYVLTDFTTEELLAYGKEYETRKSYVFKLSKKASSGDRASLLKDLGKLQEFLRNKKISKTSKKK